MKRKAGGDTTVRHLVNKHYDGAQPRAFGGRMLCAECFDGKHKYCRREGCTCWCHEAVKPERKQRDGGEQQVITEGGLPITARKE